MVGYANPDILQSRDYQLNVLRGLFNYRQSLQKEGALNEQVLAEVALGEWLYERSQRQGIEGAIAECALSGMVEERADALELLTPTLREKDRREKEIELVPTFPIIGIVGRIASGKGMIGEILQGAYDSYHFPFSDQLRQFAAATGKLPPFSRATLRDIDATLKPRFGKHVFVDWTLQAVHRMAKNLHAPQVVSVDGFRSVEETEWFLQQPHTMLIAVDTHPDPDTDVRIRFQRTLERARPGEDPPTLEGFLSNDLKERMWIDPIMVLAGRTFHNQGTREALANEVRNYFETLISVK